MSVSEFTFRPAVRSRVKLRMAIAGPSGSGKTYTALRMGRVLAGQGGIALLDTEHESASLYSDEFPFQTLPLTPPFTPERYRMGLSAAVKAGFDVLVIDSLTHEWAGQGGVLEMVDAAKRTSRNQYTAWAVPSAEHQRLVEAMLAAPIHIIATFREKTEYVIEKDKDERTVIRKMGMAPVTRDQMEFEFSVFAELDMANTLSISKSRYAVLQGRVVPKPGEEFAEELLQEMSRGADLDSRGPSEGHRLGALGDDVSPGAARDVDGGGGVAGRAANLASSPVPIVAAEVAGNSQAPSPSAARNVGGGRPMGKGSATLPDTSEATAGPLEPEGSTTEQVASDHTSEGGSGGARINPGPVNPTLPPGRDIGQEVEPPSGSRTHEPRGSRSTRRPQTPPNPEPDATDNAGVTATGAASLTEPCQTFTGSGKDMAPCERVVDGVVCGWPRSYHGKQETLA